MKSVNMRYYEQVILSAPLRTVKESKWFFVDSWKLKYIEGRACGSGTQGSLAVFTVDCDVLQLPLVGLDVSFALEI